MIPAGRRRASSAALSVCGTISECTRASRTRRAISCAYWAPKSTTRTVSKPLATRRGYQRAPPAASGRDEAAEDARQHERDERHEREEEADAEQRREVAEGDRARARRHLDGEQAVDGPHGERPPAGARVPAGHGGDAGDERAAARRRERDLVGRVAGGAAARREVAPARLEAEAAGAGHRVEAETAGVRRDRRDEARSGRCGPVRAGEDVGRAVAAGERRARH